MPDLPTNIDATYNDDTGDPSVKAHQQAHDTLHTWANAQPEQAADVNHLHAEYAAVDHTHEGGGGGVDSGWVVPALQNGWTDRDPVTYPIEYRKGSDGRVSMRGLADPPAAVALPSTIFTLPAGFRPTQEAIMIGVTNGGLTAEVRITTTGAVLVQSAEDPAFEWVSLASVAPVFADQ